MGEARKNTSHGLAALLKQSIYSRIAGCHRVLMPRRVDVQVPVLVLLMMPRAGAPIARLDGKSPLRCG